MHINASVRPVRFTRLMSRSYTFVYCSCRHLYVQYTRIFHADTIIDLLYSITFYYSLVNAKLFYRCFSE